MEFLFFTPKNTRRFHEGHGGVDLRSYRLSLSRWSLVSYRHVACRLSLVSLLISLMNSTPTPGHEGLFEAGLRLFAGRGIDGVSEADLLQAAKVSRGQLVYHYGSKEGLLAALMKQSLDLQRQALPELSPGEAPAAYLQAQLKRLARSWQGQPLAWQLYLRLRQYPATREWLDVRGEQAWHDRFLAGLVTAYRELGHRDARERAQAFDTFCQGLLWQFCLEPATFPLEERVRWFVEIHCQ